MKKLSIVIIIIIISITIYQIYSYDILNFGNPKSTLKNNENQVTFEIKKSINNDMSNFKFVATGFYENKYNLYHVKQLEVYDSHNKKILNEILTEYTNCINKESMGLLITDLNFDNYKDIMLLQDMTNAKANHIYIVWLWNEYTKKFEKNESFSNILNPAIDRQNKKILSISSNGGASHTWNMYSFINGDFLLTNSLTEEATEDSSYDNINWHYIETKIDNNISTTISDFININHTDIRAKEYYQEDSFWGLSNLKWYKSDYGSGLGINENDEIKFDE